jgi:peptidoglycan hydrolase-like protein with peptidoglycan-binding domain
MAAYVSYGEKGERVKLLQKYMNSVLYNYLRGKGKTDLMVKVDGDFGPRTLALVKILQSQTGAKVDGIVGPETAEKAAAAFGNPKFPFTPAEVTPPPKKDKPAVTPDLKNEPGIKNTLKKTAAKKSRTGIFLMAGAVAFLLLSGKKKRTSKKR